MILFFLYLAVLTYFLFFSEKYGRTAEREFSYNLTPFLEIRRFWNYREFLGLKQCSSIWQEMFWPLCRSGRSCR